MSDEDLLRRAFDWLLARDRSVAWLAGRCGPFEYDPRRDCLVAEIGDAAGYVVMTLGEPIEPFGGCPVIFSSVEPGRKDVCPCTIPVSALWPEDAA